MHYIFHYKEAIANLNWDFEQKKYKALEMLYIFFKK